MFQLIPPPLHRGALRLAHAGRKRWLRWRGGMVSGCCIIGQDGAGGILLVRHSYGSGLWSFPGGGIARGEPPDRAARREFGEELGCTLSDLRALGVRDEPFHGATNRVHLFAGRVEGAPMVDGREILEARFFLKSAMPGRLCPKVLPRLDLLG